MGIKEVIRTAARQARQYGGVDQGWINQWLIKMGIEPLGGGNEYRLNIPITAVFGATVHGQSRAEAVQKFQGMLNKVLSVGQINESDGCQHAYQVSVVPGAEVNFFSGPEDVNDLSLPQSDEEVVVVLREMLKEGVAEHGYRLDAANDLLSVVGAEPLPAVRTVSVQVPVAGLASMVVSVFEGDGYDVIHQAVLRGLAGGHPVVIAPEEIGVPAVDPKPAASVAPPEEWSGDDES